MTYDPVRQADIERRLANMAKAPRCGAKTRAGHSCKQAAREGTGKVPNARRCKRLRRASR
jgi:ribosomal protein L32